MDQNNFSLTLLQYKITCFMLEVKQKVARQKDVVDDLPLATKRALYGYFMKLRLTPASLNAFVDLFALRRVT